MERSTSCNPRGLDPRSTWASVSRSRSLRVQEAPRWNSYRSMNRFPWSFLSCRNARLPLNGRYSFFGKLVRVDRVADTECVHGSYFLPILLKTTLYSPDSLRLRLHRTLRVRKVLRRFTAFEHTVVAHVAGTAVAKFAGPRHWQWRPAVGLFGRFPGCQ